MQIQSLKVVIRCADFARSRDFYGNVLRLAVSSEWSEPQGRGCIFACGLEIYEMTRLDARFDAAFTLPVANDKVDVQMRTSSVDAWAEGLRAIWPFEGPENLPWGQRWIKLRDPDGLRIAIYEDLA